MNIIKIIFSTFVILSCSEKQIWQEIESGKTIKVESENFKLSNSANYIYKWSKPISDSNAELNYKIENDKLLFTPISNGSYQIILEIENMTQEKVHEEKFFFNVINEKNLEESNINKADKKEEIIINNIYTIQVASWTSIDKAKDDMDELIELGFDTYIEEYFDNELKEQLGD